MERLRLTTEITMTQFLNLLEYKQLYLQYVNNDRIPYDYTIEREAIANMNYERYKLKVMERLEYNKNV